MSTVSVPSRGRQVVIPTTQLIDSLKLNSVSVPSRGRQVDIRIEGESYDLWHRVSGPSRGRQVAIPNSQQSQMV